MFARKLHLLQLHFSLFPTFLSASTSTTSATSTQHPPSVSSNLRLPLLLTLHHVRWAATNMAASLATQIGDICQRLQSLRSEVVSLDRETNRYAISDISDQLRHGDGVLEKLRGTAGVHQTTGAKKEEEQAGEESEDDEEALKAARAKAKAQSAKRALRDEDPASKGRLGDDESLKYLHSLDDEIVSVFCSRTSSNRWC